ncbi:MAG TPA: GNAT family N-acetyltransferase [Candidatus Deferrimicrobium sp.]|nr:GNAT family N-acetyltransferase [Candidatus Deferrimicrobium sp.]
MEVRRLSADDLPALAREVERARAAGEFRASSDDEGQFFLKWFVLDPAIVGGALDGDDVVGFVAPEGKLVVVRPDRRRAGIGRSLVDLALDMERQRGRPDLLLGLLPGDLAGRSFLEATGFAFHSTLWDLDLARDRAVAEPVWPAGTTERPFDRTRDLEPWIALFNAAFADHATPLQLDASFIVAGLDDPAIVDDDTGVVVDTLTGDLVGFCATSPIREDGTIAGHGEIWTIGVRPDRQGAGLGRQLLRWGARRLRSIGVLDVSLSVNGRNERALGLYESEGFVRRRTRQRWARSTVPGDGGTP